MNVISKYKKFKCLFIAKFRLTLDNNAKYDTNETTDMNANGHQIKASSRGIMIDSSNSKGIKCRKDNDENCFV